MVPIDVDQGWIILPRGRTGEIGGFREQDTETDGKVGSHDVIIPNFVVQRTGLLDGSRHGSRRKENVQMLWFSGVEKVGLDQ